MCKKTPVIVFPAAGVPTSGFWKHWFDKLHSAYIISTKEGAYTKLISSL